MKSRMDPEAINTDVVSHEDNADSRTDSAAPTSRRQQRRKEPQCSSHVSVWHATMRDSCRPQSVHATECGRRLGAIVPSHAQACEVHIDGRASRS